MWPRNLTRVSQTLCTVVFDCWTHVQPVVRCQESNVTNLFWKTADIFVGGP